MIYLDNSATSLPKPEVVKKAIISALDLGNPSRGAYGAAVDALRIVTEARLAAAGLFNADPMRVCFVKNATEALNIAIGGIKGHIVTTAAEHNSVLRPLFRRGNFSVTPVDKLGRLSLSDLEKEIKQDTEAVVITHSSNLTGNVFDIAAVGELCKTKGIKLIVDGAQTAGLLPIDMKKMNISALCVSGHKSLFGPSGTGILCLAEDFTPPPLLVGGSGTDSFSLSHPSNLPEAYEAGTQNTAGIAGLLAGINYVTSLKGAAFRQADSLARTFLDGLRGKNNAQKVGEMLNTNEELNTRRIVNKNETGGIKGITIYGDIDAPLRTPLVTLNLNGMGAGNVAAILSEKYGIAVRAGAHCAPLMHKAQGTTSAIRFSFSHMNTTEDVAAAVSALKEIAE